MSNVDRIQSSEDCPTPEQFNIWLVDYSVLFVGILAIVGVWISLHLQTPARRRWTWPFSLAFALSLAGTLWFLVMIVMHYFRNRTVFNPDALYTSAYVLHTTSIIHLTCGEIALAWMVYRSYARHPRLIVIMCLVIFFMTLRLSMQVWAAFDFFNDVRRVVVPVTIALMLLAWNCAFFSALFIYRFRRKLQAAHRMHRLFPALLKFSFRHAIIPTIIVIPFVIAYIFMIVYRTELANSIHLVLGVAFRVSFTILIAHSLYVINCGDDYGNNAKREAREPYNTVDNTAINLATSFGIERRSEKHIEQFLMQVQTIFAGDKGYFVEANHQNKISVPFGFSIDRNSQSSLNVRIFSVQSKNEIHEIPMAAIEYAIDQKKMICKDFADGSFAHDDFEDLDIYLADRLELLASVLILPLTLPDSEKTKLIYMETHHTSVKSISQSDLRILDLLGKQLAASLDSARLFSELEEMNKELDEKVAERTAELKLKTALLEQAKNEALEAAKAKAVFLSNMSHEIRTPISQVILAAEMLSETDLTLDAKDHADIIVHTGRLLLNLVNDVLDFSKLESGKITIEQVEMNLYEMVRITVEAFNPDKDVKVAYYIPPDIPQMVLGDSTRIRQIITNLVSNALKFTDNGFVLVKLDTKMVEETNADRIYDVDFRVIDTGAGIAEDRLQRIFERFEQEDVSTTRLHGGTGLGLTISQNLCQLMGSKINVTSTLGKGSTFEFRIRFKSPKIVPTTPITSKLLPNATNILLLQDPNSGTISTNIVDYQLTTMGAQTTHEPFDTNVSFQKFDCIVVDLTNFEGEISNKLTRSQLSLIQPSTPIILLHRRTHETEIPILLQKYNSIRTISHPYKQSTLFKVISESLDIHRKDQKFDDLKIAQPLLRNKSFDGSDVKLISILLVEDNLVNQRIITKLILRLGFEVNVAENGLIGLEMAKKKNYDLILMDVRMPVMDGLEATRLIRRHFESKEIAYFSRTGSELSISDNIERVNNDTVIRKPFIVGLSADALTDNLQEGMNAGMDLYLTKPISKVKLTEVIRCVQKQVR